MKNLSEITDGQDIVTKEWVDDQGFMKGMTILSYGKSTWQDFMAAYTANKVVYCRASSNSNPASGSKTRLAFMAYVSNETNPTNVEFQYYRSVSSHSASQQGDQVYVYKLESNNKWTVTVREAMSKIATSGSATQSYANSKITISVPTNVSAFTNDAGYTTNIGTITEIQMNGVSKGTSGVIDLGTVITAHQDISGKVDKVSGKGLSTNDYTTNEKNKLSGIEASAQVNVQSDWNQTTTTADDYIKNKPNSMPASDVYAWAKASTKPSYTANEVGAQPTLVSGTNIKTINGTSLLGSGDLEVGGISYTAGTGIKIENGVISLNLQQAENQTF